MTVNLIYAREPLTTVRRSVFLAGPTPRAGSDTPSWRPAAIKALIQGYDRPDALTVLTPESRDGHRAAHYDDQFDWETTARRIATVVLFWIPRDLATLPGFTTNVEFGHDVGHDTRREGGVVLGCPPDCPAPERNRYLIHLAQLYNVPVRETLSDTVETALVMACSAAHPLTTKGARP